MDKTRLSPGPSVGGEKERQQPLDPAAEGISDVDDHHNRHDRQDGEKIAEHQTAPGTRGAHLAGDATSQTAAAATSCADQVHAGRLLPSRWSGSQLTFRFGARPAQNRGMATRAAMSTVDSS